MTPKFQINNLVRTADSKETFSKGETINWSYILHKITEIMKKSRLIKLIIWKRDIMKHY